LGASASLEISFDNKEAQKRAAEADPSGELANISEKTSSS
jgi:hypothetical protein